MAASVLRALLGPSSPVTVDVVPGPALPVWSGPSDIAVVATRTGAGRYAVTPAYEAARRGRLAGGHRGGGLPLRAACSGARAPYVPLPESRVRRDPVVDAHPDAAARHRPGAAARRSRRPRRRRGGAGRDRGGLRTRPRSFVNPAKTLALELLDALPVIAAEGPLADAAATRIADQLATLAGLPVTGFRMPDQRVAACAVLGGPLAPRGRRLLP